MKKEPHLYSLMKSDWIKAFITFVLSTIVAIVGDAIMLMVQSGSLSLESMHWKEIGFAILVAVITYIKKQFFTGAEGKFLTDKPKEEEKKTE